MYWLWADPIPGVLIWLLLMAIVIFGGWLITVSLFNLESYERVLVGFGVGLVIFLWLINWLGRWLPPYWTFIVSGAVVFLFGVISRRLPNIPILDKHDWNIPTWIAAGLILGWMFLRVSIGTGMFDEYKNLALISTLANGEIPSIAYFGSSELLRYHYGFHLFGASMMQIGHLMPWSAFDLSKSIIWSFSLLLAGLLGKRMLKSRYGALLMAAVLALAGGTRYLLLLLPPGVLRLFDEVVRISGSSYGTAHMLSQALAADWVVELGPPAGYPFAFLSGVNPAYIIAHDGETTIRLMLFMLGLLLFTRERNRVSIVVYVVFFSYWALASEAAFVLFAICWFLGTGILHFWRSYASQRKLTAATTALFIAAIFIPFQGGTISAIAQNQLSIFLNRNTSFSSGPLIGPIEETASRGMAGFSFQWPPAVVSAHLGILPVTNLFSLFVAVLEMGPVVLFLPWITIRWFKREGQDWLVMLLILISWMGILIPLFFKWEVARDITRITAVGVGAVVILAMKMLDEIPPFLDNGRASVLSWSTAVSIGLMCVSGVVLAAVQLTASQQVVLSQHYGDKEALLVQKVWGRLPHDSKVFGPLGKASILTGQLTGGIYNSAPRNQRETWTILNTSPTLDMFIQNGFKFVFVDSAWWQSLPSFSRKDLGSRCVSVFAEVKQDDGRFIKILDLRSCD